MEVSGQLHAPATLHSVPIGYDVGWAPELVWTHWRREKSHFPFWILNRGRPFHSLISALSYSVCPIWIMRRDLSLKVCQIVNSNVAADYALWQSNLNKDLLKLMFWTLYSTSWLQIPPITRYESVSKSFRLASWSENCKWFSFLPLRAVVSIFCESV
jgi:hypothetical protein